MATSPASPARITPELFIADSRTAPAYWLVGTLWVVLASAVQTDTSLTMLEQWMPAGLGPCTHRHPVASEGFYVLEGTCAFNAQGRTVHAGPGTLIHLPPRLPHSFSVDTAEARVLNFYAPAGFEQVVISCGQLAQELRRPSPTESAPPQNTSQIQLLSDLYGQQAVLGLPFAQPSTPALLRTSPDDQGRGQLHVAVTDQLPAVQLFGAAWRVLAAGADTGGAYDVCEVSLPAGLALPPYHGAAPVALYLLDGTLQVSPAGQPPRSAGPGAFVFVPARTACQWQAAAGPVRALLLHLGGGFADALRQAAGNEHLARELFQA